jgi:hypothetical protein
MLVGSAVLIDAGLLLLLLACIGWGQPHPINRVWHWNHIVPGLKETPDCLHTRDQSPLCYAHHRRRAASLPSGEVSEINLLPLRQPGSGWTVCFSGAVLRLWHAAGGPLSEASASLPHLPIGAVSVRSLCHAWRVSIYEIWRKSEPRQRKLNLGGFHNWDSYTVSFSYADGLKGPRKCKLLNRVDGEKTLEVKVSASVNRCSWLSLRYNFFLTIATGQKPNVNCKICSSVSRYPL